MNKSKEWYQRRRQGITGSDIGAICFLNPYRSPLEVYLDKVSEEEQQDISSEPIYWGNRLEDVIADEYAIRQNVKVSVEPNILQHKEYDFILGSIDRWVNDGEYILECKTIGSRLINQLGEVGTDQIPSYWLAQVAWYVAITDTPKADIAVLAAGQDFRIYTYERNIELEDKLIKIACNFWSNHIEKRIPPKCVNTRDTFNLFPQSNYQEIVAESNIMEKLEQLKSLKKEENRIADTIEKLKTDIQEFMRDYDVLIDNQGNVIATWKNTTPRSFFDLKRFKDEAKDLYLKYTSHAKQSRMFLIK
jgi:putative phage-type endonuclease